MAPLISAELKKYGHSIELVSEKNAKGAWAFKSKTGNFKMSLHFNAYKQGSATGVEVLYKKDSMKTVASSMSKAIAKAMGLTNRGGKKRTDLYMMNIGFDILIEVCFHDNSKDLAAYNKNRTAVVSAIVAEIIKVVGGKKSTGSSSSSIGSTTKPTTSTAYYPKANYTGSSLVDALNKIKVTSSFANRKKIAKANGISLYVGTASQNTKLLNLLKQGKLKK